VVSIGNQRHSPGNTSYTSRPQRHRWSSLVIAGSSKIRSRHQKTSPMPGFATACSSQHWLWLAAPLTVSGAASYFSPSLDG